MPQSLANVLVHLVFSTKDRVPLIRADVESELYAYTSKVLDTSDSPMIAIGGIEDHVHILFKLSRKFAIADLVETVKTDTSRWIKSKGAAYTDFYWQSGYGAFSVSPTTADKVIGYIRNQTEHHRAKSFQDEALFHPNNVNRKPRGRLLVPCACPPGGMGYQEKHVRM